MKYIKTFENRKIKGHWSYENVKEEALRFKRRSDFQKNSLSAYTIAYKNSWLDDVRICIKKWLVR